MHVFNACVYCTCFNDDMNRVVFWFDSSILRPRVRLKYNMDIIYKELIANNVDIDRNTLEFCIKEIYAEYDDMYKDLMNRVMFDDLFRVWELMGASSFGHCMAFLTMVWASGNTTEECVRKAVKLTIPILKSIDMMPYRLRVLAFSIRKTPVVSFKNRACICVLIAYVIYKIGMQYLL